MIEGKLLKYNIEFEILNDSRLNLGLILNSYLNMIEKRQRLHSMEVSTTSEEGLQHISSPSRDGHLDICIFSVE